MTKIVCDCHDTKKNYWQSCVRPGDERGCLGLCLTCVCVLAGELKALTPVSRHVHVSRLCEGRRPHTVLCNWHFNFRIYMKFFVCMYREGYPGTERARFVAWGVYQEIGHRFFAPWTCVYGIYHTVNIIYPLGIAFWCIYMRALVFTLFHLVRFTKCFFFIIIIFLIFYASLVR